MKRSDILRILEEALEKHTNISSSCCNLGINSESLSSVLGELEKAGMLPPSYMKPIEFINGKQYPLIPGDFKNDKGIWCTPGQREWEPEESDTKDEQDEN